MRRAILAGGLRAGARDLAAAFAIHCLRGAGALVILNVAWSARRHGG